MMMGTTTVSHVALEIQPDGRRVEFDMDDENCVIIQDDENCASCCLTVRGLNLTMAMMMIIMCQRVELDPLKFRHCVHQRGLHIVQTNTRTPSCDHTNTDTQTHKQNIKHSHTQTHADKLLLQTSK